MTNPTAPAGRLRPYDPDRDRPATHRIWREVGWFSGDGQEPMLDHFLGAGRTMVAELDGTAECVAATAPGTIRYLDDDLALSAVTALATSRVARRQGLGKRLLADLIAQEAAAGALVSMLGMFDQGFYDRLGYGSGCYERWIQFDPATLTVRRPVRVPRRLTGADWQAVHQAMLQRWRRHGACNLFPAAFRRAEMGWTADGFGLGFADDHGVLTHCFWGKGDAEYGPFEITMMAFQNRDQFLDLMALLRSLGDQVRLVGMREPAGIQLQDLLAYPIRMRQATKGSSFENSCSALALWQARICDLAGCLAHTHLQGPPLTFNLKLHDPITPHLPKEAPWQGLTGNYVVTLGPSSGADPGTAAARPTLAASVGAFTRLWLGIRPASGLAVTDALDAPPALLDALDRIFCLPDPHPDWEF